MKDTRRRRVSRRRQGEGRPCRGPTRRESAPGAWPVQVAVGGHPPPRPPPGPTKTTRRWRRPKRRPLVVVLRERLPPLQPCHAADRPLRPATGKAAATRRSLVGLTSPTPGRHPPTAPGVFLGRGPRRGAVVSPRLVRRRVSQRTPSTRAATVAATTNKMMAVMWTMNRTIRSAHGLGWSRPWGLPSAAVAGEQAVWGTDVCLRLSFLFNGVPSGQRNHTRRTRDSPLCPPRPSGWWGHQRPSAILSKRCVPARHTPSMLSSRPHPLLSGPLFQWGCRAPRPVTAAGAPTVQQHYGPLGMRLMGNKRADVGCWKTRTPTAPAPVQSISGYMRSSGLAPCYI